ncbi:MAG: tyrosine-type recombinase/integrase [Bacteroidales bacterium]
MEPLTTAPAIKTKQRSLNEVITDFLSSQDVRESSRQLYKRTIQQFFTWVTDNNINLDEISRIDIIKYKAALFEKGLSSLTVGSYLTIVRKFFQWTETEKIYPNIAKGIKTPKRSQKFKKQHLTTDSCMELLNHYRSKRDYAIVNLMLRTGLRTIEVSRLNIDDITFKSNQRVLMIHGKGHNEKDEFVVLTDKAYEPIKEYLETRQVNNNSPLFASESNNNRGKQLTTKTISTIVKKGLKAIGLDGKEFTAHSLRHTTAVNILKAGGSLYSTQVTLRHTNPATTQIYTESIKEEQRLRNPAEKLIDSMLN